MTTTSSLIFGRQSSFRNLNVLALALLAEKKVRENSKSLSAEQLTSTWKQTEHQLVGEQS